MVGSFEGAGKVVMGFCVVSTMVGSSCGIFAAAEREGTGRGRGSDGVLEGEESSVVLHGFSHEEGDDVVDC